MADPITIADLPLLRAGLLRADPSSKVARHMVEVCNLALQLAEKNRRLRDAIGALTECLGATLEIDGSDFEDIMVEHGLFVKVPASETFKEEYDADEMYVLEWSREAEIAKERK